MARWRVFGISNTSGLETSLDIEASTANVAKLIAERSEMTVADVIEIDAQLDSPAPAELEPASDAEAAWNAARIAGSAAAQTRPRRGEIICPNTNCGYMGRPRIAPRGSCLIALFLLLFGLLPGILYAVFFRGYRYYCPRCGLQLGADN